MKTKIKSIVLIIVAIIFVISAVSYYTTAIEKQKELVYSELVQYFEDDIVTSFEVKGDLKMTLHILKLDENGVPTYQTENY